jgi:hypothetical protein
VHHLRLLHLRIHLETAEALHTEIAEEEHRNSVVAVGEVVVRLLELEHLHLLVLLLIYLLDPLCVCVCVYVV